MFQDAPEFKVAIDGQFAEDLTLHKLPVMFSAIARRVEIDGQVAVQFALKGLFEKLRDLLLLFRRQKVRLGQQENDVRGVPREFADQFQVMLGEGPIGTDRQKGGADFGKPVFGSGFVVFEDAAQPGRVDQPQIGVRLERGQLNVHEVDILLVARIFCL